MPLLVVSGLGQPAGSEIDEDAEGFRITSELLPVENEDSQALLRYFKKSDAEGLAWNGREHTGRNKFKVKIVGRVTSTIHYCISTFSQSLKME